MGRMNAAVLNGERKGFRQLAAAGYFWAVNDVANMPDTPLTTLTRGDHARVAITNDTVFPHAMHLHPGRQMPTTDR